MVMRLTYEAYLQFGKYDGVEDDPDGPAHERLWRGRVNADDSDEILAGGGCIKEHGAVKCMWKSVTCQLGVVIKTQVNDYIAMTNDKPLRDKTRDLASWGASLTIASAETAKIIGSRWEESASRCEMEELSAEACHEIEAAVITSTQKVAQILQDKGVFQREKLIQELNKEGKAIRFLSPEMKGDGELCTAAVAQGVCVCVCVCVTALRQYIVLATR